MGYEEIENTITIIVILDFITKYILPIWFFIISIVVTNQLYKIELNTRSKN